MPRWTTHPCILYQVCAARGTDAAVGTYVNDLSGLVNWQNWLQLKSVEINLMYGFQETVASNLFQLLRHEA